VQFQIWDFPGQLDFFDPAFDSEAIFGGCGALIFVIDAQDEYDEALRKLHMTVTKAIKVNPRISFEVFIHKVDGLSDDHKIGKCPPHTAHAPPHTHMHHRTRTHTTRR
jgi:Ras-related GTP-binding protein C/D